MPNKPSEMVLYRLDTILESISFIEQNPTINPMKTTE